MYIYMLVTSDFKSFNCAEYLVSSMDKSKIKLNCLVIINLFDLLKKKTS